jgi:hypothetical protein
MLIVARINHTHIVKGCGIVLHRRISFQNGTAHQSINPVLMSAKMSSVFIDYSKIDFHHLR